VLGVPLGTQDPSTPTARLCQTLACQKFGRCTFDEALPLVALDVDSCVAELDGAGAIDVVCCVAVVVNFPITMENSFAHAACDAVDGQFPRAHMRNYVMCLGTWAKKSDPLLQGPSNWDFPLSASSNRVPPRARESRS